jgi:hypothetical protein
MNDKTGGGRGPRRAGALAAGALAVLAAVLLAAGCASSSTSTVSGSGTSTYTQEVTFAQCIRSHGVPGFPNPDAAGKFSINATMLDSSRTQAAYGTCRHLLPNGGPNLSQIEQEQQQKQAQQLPELLKWQQCVRSHGEPDFSLGLGSQSPAPGNKASVDPNTPQFQAALNACQHLLPPGDHVSVNTSTSRS